MDAAIVNLCNLVCNLILLWACTHSSLWMWDVCAKFLVGGHTGYSSGPTQYMTAPFPHHIGYTTLNHMVWNFLLLPERIKKKSLTCPFLSQGQDPIRLRDRRVAREEIYYNCNRASLLSKGIREESGPELKQQGRFIGLSWPAEGKQSRAQKRDFVVNHYLPVRTWQPHVAFPSAADSVPGTEREAPPARTASVSVTVQSADRAFVVVWTRVRGKWTLASKSC